jgi:hypothetical protein
MIGTSLYYLERSGGAGLKVFWMQQEVATVMFGIHGQVREGHGRSTPTTFISAREWENCSLPVCSVSAKPEAPPPSGWGLRIPAAGFGRGSDYPNPPRSVL